MSYEKTKLSFLCELFHTVRFVFRWRFTWAGRIWCVPSRSAVVFWRRVWWFLIWAARNWRNTSISWSSADWTPALNPARSAVCLHHWRDTANRPPPKPNTSIRSDTFNVSLACQSHSEKDVLKDVFLQVQCTKCQFVWCFKCHSPWHEGLKCRDYKKGDKLLRNWASVIEHGQRNAQKCPRCKVSSVLEILLVSKSTDTVSKDDDKRQKEGGIWSCKTKLSKTFFRALIYFVEGGYVK